MTEKRWRFQNRVYFRKLIFNLLKMPQSEKIMSIEITSALALASTSASHVDYVTTEGEGGKEYIQNNNAYKSFVK